MLRFFLILLYAALPVYLIKTEVLGIPTTALEIATYAIAGLTVILFFVKPEFKTEILQYLNGLWTKERAFCVSVLVFLGAMLLATFVTVDLRRSLGVFKGWFFDPGLAALLVYLLTKGIQDLKKFVLGLNIGTAALSFYGLWEFFTPPQILQNAADYNSYLVRVNSIFQSANYHAFLVAPVIALTIGVLVWNWPTLSRVFKIIAVGSLIFNVWSLFLTYSYGAYFGLGLAILFLVINFIPRIHQNKILLSGTVFIFIVVAVAIIFNVVSSAKFQRDFTNLSGDSSLRGRIEVWKTSQEIIKNNFWMGLGLGNFDEGYLKYVNQAIDTKPLEDVVIHAHNIFLNFWNESGIIGLLAFLLLLFQIFKLLRGAKLADRGLALGASAGLIQILGHGLIDTPYFKNDASYLFWLLVVVLVILDENQK